ncbi:glycosyltransferase family 2 protein [Nibrella viscosa]|uniref:Glycosyltransferase family 2 protein n=1 Tax=Nibrella viscosa TaxID=1084524 RepID=A0ABP8JSX4_9BACT
MQAVKLPVDLSIIYVNYKTPHLIIDSLTSVYQYTSGVNLEVLIVDNDSGDNSRQAITRLFPDVRWFDMGYNAGFSRANNLAIGHARGRNILLLNSDTLVLDNLLARCVCLLDERPEIAAVSAMQINREGQVHHDIFDTFGKIRRYFYIVPQRPGFQKLLHRFIPDNHYDDPNEVDWLSGSFLMTRKSIIDKAGKLDESFFMYGEDVEWSFRLRQHGRMLLLRDAYFVHLEYGSSNEYQQQSITYINRFRPQMQVSQLLWIRKQYGVGAYLLLILHYLLLIPIIFGWKILVNLRNRERVFSNLSNQQEFAKQVGIYLRFFWKTVLNTPYLYKI